MSRAGNVRRAGICGSISASGGVVLGLMVYHAVTRPLPLAGLLLAAFGALIGSALVAAGVVLYRSGVTTPRTARIAGWNVLGIVVIGAAMGLFYAYQSAVGTSPPAPVFSGAVVVGISAVAHVLIGINDVRRIRAGELAQERQKLSVLNRLVRHNLRTEAQLLYSYADGVREITPGDDVGGIADRIASSGATFVEMHDQITLLQEVIDGDLQPTPVDLTAMTEACVREVRDQYPDATIETDVPPDSRVLAGEYLEHALRELLENAIEHAESGTPRVTVSLVEADGAWVDLAVQDDGPGIPEQERQVVLGEQPVTQLDHASGLGLWLVRWIADAYGGELDIRQPEGGGSDVRLRLRAA